MISQIVSSSWNYVILIGFFFPVMFAIFSPVYLIAAVHSSFKFNLDFINKEKSIIFLSLIFFIIKFFQSPSADTIIFLKTFFGFGFFYYYFAYFNNKNFDKILILSISIYLPLEFLFINRDHFHDLTNIFLSGDQYRRPVGFCENSTIMATVLIVFLITLKDRLSWKWNLALVSSVIFCFSGMGTLGLIYVFIVSKMKSFSRNYKKIIIFIVFSIILYAFFYWLIRDNFRIGSRVGKISPNYIFFLLDMKYKIITQSFSEFPNWLTIFIGLPWKGEIAHSGSDFGLGDIFFMSGILGVMLNVYLIHIWIKDRSIKYFLILSLFHYSALWLPGGQIFLGYIIGHYSNRNQHSNLPN